jgi:predicted enzyme related to lactoylglutathione lyase
VGNDRVNTAIRPRAARRADSLPSVMGRKRLVGMELFCARAGESAAFYAWLLSSDAEFGSDDWEPIHLLSDRGVISVRRTEPGGAGEMWVPALLVDNVEDTGNRMKAEGGSWETVDGRTYVVDAEGVWTRIIAADAVPFGLDTETVKETVLDYITTDVAGVAATYQRVLGLESVEFVDDPHDYTLLVDHKHIAMGLANYATAAETPVPHPSWMLYFDVPDVKAYLARAVQAGAKVVIPPTREGYNDWCVLVDPFGITFGLSTYYDLREGDWQVRLESGEIVDLGDAATLG